MTKPEIAKKTSTPLKPPGTGQPGVEGDDEQHGDRPQALDVRTPLILLAFRGS